jgi:2-polyprenyl-6-hydroxyphenyl methylase/3-demethylubiquinone-9 3-methyltransferase
MHFPVHVNVFRREIHRRVSDTSKTNPNWDSKPDRVKQASRATLSQMHLLRRALHTTSSINPAEIAHFSRLSSQWWDEAGEFSFLHKMNPVRIRFIREKLLEVARDEQPALDASTSVLKGLDVLDVGCGGGLLSEVLLSRSRTGSENFISIRVLHVSARKPSASMLPRRISPSQSCMRHKI